jgi:hypothetical protein
MKTKLVWATLSIVLVLSLISAASAQPSAGVKKGDWIEYQVAFTGTPSADHSITQARMEVLDVQGPVIQVNIISTYANGTQISTNSTLNLQTGQLIDDFIIPANLKTGDQFLDSRVGNISISSTEQRTYAGATRTVVSATSLDNTYVWDQATGISVEGNSEGADYSMHSLATATNIWQAQASTVDPVIVYALVIVVVVILAATVVIVVMRRKGKTKN